MNSADGRCLVLVAGVGRSGTSLFTGILGQVGFHIPQPEIKADATNPRGFGEPAWVVSFHRGLMDRRRVTVFDARPAAWEKTNAAADEDGTRAELRDWLGAQLGESDAVVVKDPRIGWFLPLWYGAAADAGVTPSFVGMLRHPGEILASAKKHYGTWQSDASRAAAWLNVTLETERATRQRPRAFVRYEDLLGDWQAELNRVGELLEIPKLATVTRTGAPQVDEFVDPALHRNRVPWEGLEVPARVLDMAERVWADVQRLAERGGDTPELRAALDGSRQAYEELYAEAEAIAQSSVTAVRPKPKPTQPAARPSLRVRVARRIPPRYRQRIRRALGAGRRSG